VNHEWRTLTRITAPVLDPVTQSEIYRHLRLVEDATEKAYADAVAEVAREYVEQYSGTALLTQTWELTLDEWWQGVLELPYPPLQSVSSIKYIDSDGVEQTLSASAYSVTTGDPVGYVQFAADTTVPVARAEAGAIRIRFVSGYTAAADIPASLRQAVLLMTAQWFENREPVLLSGAIPQQIPMTARALMDQYRSRWL
jgi:uncharacterized phiE125 gp8 family phage protein